MEVDIVFKGAKGEKGDDGEMGFRGRTGNKGQTGTRASNLKICLLCQHLCSCFSFSLDINILYVCA